MDIASLAEETSKDFVETSLCFEHHKRYHVFTYTYKENAI